MWPRVMSVSVLAVCAAAAAQAEDPYLRYVRTAPEFRPVRQDRELLTGRWRTWVYMPWRYRWTIGTEEDGGRFCRDYGFNGGFTDHGAGPLDWLERWGLQFYNDHTAGKGDLYLHRKKSWRDDQFDGRALRNGARGPRPLDGPARERLAALTRKRVAGLRHHPMRVAYALDDEISWGSFVKPIPWRLHDDDADYAGWLQLYYGGVDVPKPQFVTPEDVRGQLKGQLRDIDLSPFLDRMTYNDSYWACVLGDLVEAANEADPETPCGFVGGQSPNLFGGYDYAKLCRKVQFIEAYNIGSAQEVIRSLNPGNAMPVVMTHFHKDARGVANDIWQSWFYFAHGNRGMIGWVEGWFDGATPRPWLRDFSDTLKELSRIQGPKMVGAEWVHDGVALYYSHPSIQVSWMLDAEAHGSTWCNRNGDHRLGTSHLVRKAWEYLLTDSGLQYNHLAYADVVVNGVPDEYQVVVLPACYALSDIEAARLRAFCERGGTLIADFACGLFDQHGRGRTAGPCDDIFGVTHDGTETAADLFAPRLWVETDQDAGYSYRRYAELFGTLPVELQDGFASAEKRLPVHTVSPIGEGRAVYVNLSPQRYLQYRQDGVADPSRRDVFVRYVRDAGVVPRLQVTGPDGKRPRDIEVTTWRKDGRMLCFVVRNAEVSGSAVGGGGVEGLRNWRGPITVRFPEHVRACRDERTGRVLGDGDTFTFDFVPTEAAFFSYGARR